MRDRILDIVFPFRRATLDLLRNPSPELVLWTLLVLLVFGPGIAYALLVGS